MKKVIPFILLICSGFVNAQKKESNSLGKRVGDSLYMNDGAIFVVKEHVNFGTGSNGQKGFEFVFTSPLSIAGMEKLPSNWSHMSMVVKDYKFYSSKKTGDKIYIIMGGGNIVNYWCDVYSAMDAGEVVVNGINDKKTLAAAGEPESSVADEIAKLNKLYKDSVITKDEYETQKKKVLSR